MKNRSFIVYLFAAGFYSILGQVVLLRELNVAFYGIELIYLISFAFWLVGTALGVSFGRSTIVPKEEIIQIFFLLSAFFLIADIVYIRGIRNIFGGVPGGYLPFLTQIVGLIIALLPIGFLSGLLFQSTAKRFIETGETLAKAYALESAGGIIGAFISTALLNLGINNFAGGIICGLVLIFIVVFYSIYSSIKNIRIASVILAAAFAYVLIFSHHFDLLMTSWNHLFLIESIDTPYSRVTITSPEGQICVFEDDILSYETQSISAEEFVQMAVLQHTNPENVLVVGGGFAGTISELFKLPVKKIDYVEINEDLINAVQKYLPAESGNELINKKVNLIYSDPRKFLQSQHQYDIIISGMPEPMSAQTNRFYTKEFFEQCAASLNEKGLLAFKIRSSENIWTNQLIERNSEIYNAVKSIFHNVMILPGVDNIFIASKSDLTTNTDLLINRFMERNLETKLVSPQYIHYVYTNDRFKEIQNLISGSSDNINSDLRPICYSFTISIWLSKFFPDLIFSEHNLLLNLNTIWPYILIVILITLFYIFKKSHVAKRIIQVFAAGFIGMVLEIILILIYQNRNGILYRDIGILIMAFMVGLTLGSYFIDRIFRLKNNKYLKRLPGGLFLAFLLLNLLIYFFITSNLMNSLLIIFAALLIDGMLVSGIFAAVSLIQVEDQKIIIRQLYTADLIGGCAGSLIASLLLIPAYGFLFVLLALMGISLATWIAGLDFR